MSQLQFTEKRYPSHVRYEVVNLQNGTWITVSDMLPVEMRPNGSQTTISVVLLQLIQGSSTPLPDEGKNTLA